MRCCKYHSTLTPQLSNGKRNFGSRTQSIEQIYFNTIRRKNIGSDLGKFAAVVPAIVTDSNLYLGQVGKGLFQIIGQSLSSSSHRIDIHTIRSGSHNSTQTTRTKFEILINRLYQIGLIFVIEHGTHSGLCFFVIAIAQPYLSFGGHLFQ